MCAYRRYLDIPTAFAESFIALAHAANAGEDDQLGLRLDTDGLRLHLSNSPRRFNLYLVLVREGSAVHALVCSEARIEAEVAIDLDAPQEAAAVALRAWHSTL